MTRDLKLLIGWQAGSLRLMTARLALLFACAAPTAIGVEWAVPAGWSEVPRLVQRAADPTLSMVLGALGGLSGHAFGLALIGLGIWLVLDRLLSGAAIGVLSPLTPPLALGRAMDSDAGLRSGIRTYGWPRLGTLLRLWGWSVLLTVVGFALLELLWEPLVIAGERHGWTGLHRFVTLPLLRIGLSRVWLSWMGAFALWAKAAIVADRRRRAWRTARVVLGVLRRTPAAVALTVSLLFITQVAGLALLGAFLPAQGGGFAWLVWLLWQTWVWHATSRLVSQVYQSDRCSDLRAFSDAPLSFDAIRMRATPDSPGPTG